MNEMPSSFSRGLFSSYVEARALLLVTGEEGTEFWYHALLLKLKVPCSKDAEQEIRNRDFSRFEFDAME